MSRDAVWIVLQRASSERWFLKEMFHHPEEALRKYRLTLDEKRALLSGSIADIEACAGITLSPWLKERFEEAMQGVPCHDAYFAQEEGLSLMGNKAVDLVEEFLRNKDDWAWD